VISVGLTGNVASGKSLVASYWASAGVPVIGADELSRRVVRPGSPGLRAVRAEFGDRVVADDGSLDRAALRERVFTDDQARSRLEAILHPRIWELRSEWLAERRDEGAPLVVSEIPLLFETGRAGDFDVTVLVVAPDSLRLQRLIETRGLDEAEARRIMAAQMDQEEKRGLADIVIENAGSKEDLAAEAERVLAALRTRAPVEWVRIDLHLHTAGSYDCLSDPERVLDVALAKGYRRLAITDHNRLEVALLMAEAHPDRIIPGEEVRTAEGIDVIGLFLTEEISKGTRAHDVIARIRDQGGICYLPHPYAPGKGGGGRLAEELAPACDIVEVFNARLHSARANQRAAALAARHGTLAGAGSDAHTLGEIGNAYVELPMHANRADALLAALARARTGGEEASRLVHLASTWAKVCKKLPFARRDEWRAGGHAQ
jgi:dephospho-CoA kinase